MGESVSSGVRSKIADLSAGWQLLPGDRDRLKGFYNKLDIADKPKLDKLEIYILNSDYAPENTSWRLYANLGNGDMIEAGTLLDTGFKSTDVGAWVLVVFRDKLSSELDSRTVVDPQNMTESRVDNEKLFYDLDPSSKKALSEGLYSYAAMGGEIQMAIEQSKRRTKALYGVASWMAGMIAGLGYYDSSGKTDAGILAWSGLVYAVLRTYTRRKINEVVDSLPEQAIQVFSQLPSGVTQLED